MSWTEDRVSLLTKLWGEGHTAAEIAKKLGGVTRNAVIGKAHRLKLSNRASPIQQNKKPANSNAVKTQRVTPIKSAVKTKPTLKQEKPLAQATTNVDIVQKEKPKARLAKDGKLHSLMDLQPRQCRWPSGDPKEDDFGFCGDHSMVGLPYCEEHAKQAYQATTRNRIFNAGKTAQANEKKQVKASAS